MVYDSVSLIPQEAYLDLGHSFRCLGAALDALLSNGVANFKGLLKFAGFGESNAPSLRYSLPRQWYRTVEQTGLLIVAIVFGNSTIS